MAFSGRDASIVKYKDPFDAEVIKVTVHDEDAVKLFEGLGTILDILNRAGIPVHDYTKLEKGVLYRDIDPISMAVVYTWVLHPPKKLTIVVEVSLRSIHPPAGDIGKYILDELEAAGVPVHAFGTGRLTETEHLTKWGTRIYTWTPH